MSAAAMLGPMLGISISASGPSFATAVMSSWDESMVPAARRYAFARYPARLLLLEQIRHFAQHVRCLLDSNWEVRGIHAS